MANLSAKARIVIRRTPSEVFDAFVNAESMSKFWFTRRDAGLEQGKSFSWFLGSGDDAPSFEVHVKELEHPNKIVIDWGDDDGYTQVTWSLEKTEDGDTILTIEETGFAGSNEEILAGALDSTGGFNQVIVAAKAFVEHGIELNVVADHA